MVKKGKASQKEPSVKVGTLKVKKESVKQLTPKDSKQIKGGICGRPKSQCSALD